MFGGHLYAYTLLGIRENSKGEVEFLILDPHYTGNDKPKPIIDKKGIVWKGKEIFLDTCFYNFCLPLLKKLD